MSNPFTVVATRFPATPVGTCIACLAPVRKARVLAEITLYLDASATPRGSYYFADDYGLVSEDRGAYTGDPTYRRHRCSKPVMRGWNGDER